MVRQDKAKTLAATLAVALSLAGQAAAARNPSLGFSKSHLQKNGIHIGFLPAWGEALHSSTATSLNADLDVPMSVVGAYAQINPNDPTFKQMDVYVQDILKQPGDKPIFAIALMPDSGLASVTQTVANNIAAKMASLNAMNITVWLRYAHEMNGDWYAWGQKPADFVTSWNMVARTVKARAPDTYMLWSPNSLMASDVNSVYGGYTPYWPAPDTVDLVGLSFYAYGGKDRLNIMPDIAYSSNLMATFDAMYATPNNLSFVLSETGASYTRNSTSGLAAPGNCSEVDIKLDWLSFLTSSALKAIAPKYVSSVWFEVIKDENAAGDTPIKEEDFRVISGNGTLRNLALNYLEQNNSAIVWSPAYVNAAGLQSSSLQVVGATATPTARPNSTARPIGSNANAGSNSTTSKTKSAAMPSFSVVPGTAAALALVSLALLSLA